MFQNHSIAAYPLLAEVTKLMEGGKFEQAASLAIRHLRQHPNEPRGLMLIGLAAMRLGALEQAEQFFRQGLEYGASQAEVKRNLALLFNQQERLGASLNALEDVLQDHNDPSLRSIFSLVLDKLGKTHEAMDIRKSLVTQYPGNPFYWIAYGHSLRAAGQVGEAVIAYRKATELDYECGEAWWGLASIKSRILTDEDIVQIKRALDVAVDIRNSAPAHFALARAYHDRAAYQEAFQHYEIGNRQRAESIGYNAQELTQEVEATSHIATPELMSRLRRHASDGPVPIFIVSLPRSGSTLLEQMLACHPQIEATGELPYIPAILRSIMEVSTRLKKITVPQLVAQLTNEQADALGQDYLQRCQLHRKTNRPYFIDKLPHNWSNIFFIRRILPQAVFLNIRRPAMDCCFSNFTQSFSTAHASSFALEDIGRCYVDYMRYMDIIHRADPDLVHHISYTQLVEDAENILRGALAHIGAEWDPRVLEFYKLDRVVRTPSSEQVRRPLNREGMGNWRPYDQWLAPLRSALGSLAGDMS